MLNQKPEVRAAMRIVRERLRGVPAVLFGGAIRDAILGRPIKDLDIVVSGVPSEGVRPLFEGYRGHRTGLGGWKFKIEDVEVDVWALKDTWAFSKMMLDHEPTFEDLMRTTLFNLEAVAISLVEPNAVYDGGFEEALESRVLDVVFAPNPIPHLNVVRAAVLCKRYELKPGPGVLRFVAEHAPTVSFTRLMDLQRHHYGGRNSDGSFRHPYPVMAYELEEFLHNAGVEAKHGTHP